MTNQSKSIIAALVLAGLFLLMPLLVGLITQRAVADWKATKGETAAIELINYQRSWFGSKMQLATSLNQTSLRLNCQANHGIVNATFVCQPDENPTWQLISRLSLFGDIDSTLLIEALAFSTPSLDAIIDSVKIHLHSKRFQPDHSITGKIGLIHLSGKTDEIIASNIHIQGDFSRISSALPIGSLSILGQLKFDVDSTFKFASELTLTEKHQRLEADSVTYLQRKPQSLPTSQFAIVEPEQWGERFDIKATHIDKATLETILARLMQDIIAEQSDEAAFGNNARFIELLPLYYQLIGKGSTLQAHYLSTVTGRKAQASYQLELLENIGLGDHILLTLQPDAYVNKFNIAFQMDSETGDHPWQTRFPLVFSDGRYRSQFSLSPTGATLNNKPLTSEQALQFLPDFH